MKASRKTTAILAAGIAAAAALSFTGGVNARQSSGSTEPVLVFAVTNYENRPEIDPVVMVTRRGTFAEPLGSATTVTDAAMAAFIRRYLKVGPGFRVLFGGNPVGTATIKAPPGDPGIAIETPVTLKTSITINSTQQALAISGSQHLPGERPVSLRQSPTSSDNNLALAVAKTVLSKYGVKAEPNAIKTVYLARVQRDSKDNQYDLVGQFRTDAGKNRHELLIIAEPNSSGTGYHAGYVWHNRSVRDSDDGTHVEQTFIDACDLNGDGIAEVIVRSLYYESHDYTIYQKKRGGTWRAVYRGAGGGV